MAWLNGLVKRARLRALGLRLRDALQRHEEAAARLDSVVREVLRK